MMNLLCFHVRGDFGIDGKGNDRYLVWKDLKENAASAATIKAIERTAQKWKSSLL